MEFFYHYAINGFEENENNAAIIHIHYGAKIMPFPIFKKDIRMFLTAIISSQEIEGTGIASLLAGKEVDIKVLNRLLRGEP